MKPVEFIYQQEQIRVHRGGDQVWFAAIDICRVLGYSNPNNIVKKLLDEDERKLEYLTDPSGQKRKTWNINEAGLYSLILSSSKPEAKAFKRWITHEVLPVIRKAGKFTTEEQQQREFDLQAVTKRINKNKSIISDLQSGIKDLKKSIKADETLRNDLILNPQKRIFLKLNIRGR